MASWDGWAYGYDIENRLISAIKGGDSVSYTYDPLGRLASQTHNGTVTTYLYDGVEPIQDMDGSGNVLRRYINGAGVDERMVFLKYNTGTGALDERHYYHTNHQGSVIAMHEDDGTVETYTYDAYGDLKSGNTVQPFQYTGRRWDNDTGLYYYRARFYNPVIGRFLQVDPIGYKDDMNLYGYVANDPMNKTDPFGLEAICDEDGKNCKENNEDEPDEIVVTAKPIKEEKLKENKSFPGLVSYLCKINMEPNGCGAKDDWKSKFIPDKVGDIDISKACEAHDKCFVTQDSDFETCNNQFKSDILNNNAKQVTSKRGGTYTSRPVNLADFYYRGVSGEAGKAAFQKAQKLAKSCSGK